MKFYKCNKCGNIFEVIKDSAIVPVCCSESMSELKANTNEEASVEKHIPVIVKEKNKVVVYVGKTIHPMEEKHYIEWIAIETDQGRYLKHLYPNNLPLVTFSLYDEYEKILKAYAYCNIHGLWSGE